MVNAGKTKFSPFFFRIFPLKCSVFNLLYYSIKRRRNKEESMEKEKEGYCQVIVGNSFIQTNECLASV